MKSDVCIIQRKWPFHKKRLTLDSKKNILITEYETMFSYRQDKIHLHTVDDDPSRVKQKSLGSLILSVFFTIALFILLSTWAWDPPASHDDAVVYIISQALLFFFTIIVIGSYFRLKSDNMVFYFRESGRFAFAINVNKPNMKDYESFINDLNATLSEISHKGFIKVALENIPTRILIEEFSASYVKELMNRGVDVQALLAFTQKNIQKS